MRLSIGNKLIGGFLAVSVIFGITSGVSFFYMKKVNHSYSDLINKRAAVLINAKDMQVLSLTQTNELRGFLLTSNTDGITELDTANARLDALIDETGQMVSSAENKEAIRKLVVLNQEFKRKYEQLLSMFEKDRNQEEALTFFKTSVFPIGNQMSPQAKIIENNQINQMNEGIRFNTEMVDRVATTTAFLGIGTFIAAMIIGLWISGKITGGLAKLSNAISGISSGTIHQLPRIDRVSKDEVGDIAAAFNAMAQALEEHDQSEQEFNRALQERSWLETRIAEMATMNQGIHDLQEFARLFITKITPMVGAGYGVFYILQKTGDEPILRRVSAYAYDEQDFSRECFRLGEGLVGQSALECRKIEIDHVPQTYLRIASGTGMAAPAQIVILPIEFDGDVTAVIELASFRRFTPIEHALLQQVLGHIGVTINSIEGRMQVVKLLLESQTLTEELQSQSEELQMQQEELKSINEKLEEQYNKSEQKTKELEKAKLELEEKAKQLVESSKYKSEFLANMSHELRTPLNSLLILARLLADNDDGNLTNKQVNFARTIHASGNDLLQLINDILDLSKVESGKMDIHPEEVDVGSVLDFAEHQFLPVAREKGLDFKIRTDNDIPNVIYTDEQRLQQILKNFLSNAFKFTERGSVVLHVGKAKNEAMARFPFQYAGSVLVFSVSDTGIGISKDKQCVIFEAFHQGDGTTSRKYGGTGLGLAISRNIAELLGGFIEVDSEEGGGSTFSFYLPHYRESAHVERMFVNEEAAVGLVRETGSISVQSAEPAAVMKDMEERIQETPSDDALLAGKKILIVDDDMRNVFALTTALESHRMDVLFAENGLEGIKVLHENPDIDLVFMDIMMPAMDGYEAMRTIRQNSAFASLPIIALTAKAMKHDRTKCLEAGASDYISKPVDLEQLISLMKVWLFR